MGRILISVVGGSSINRELAKTAEQVGREIARRGAVLLCGGLAGAMEAACRGAKAEGGLTVGIIPGDDANDANDYVDVVIPTGIGYARNFLVASAGRGVVAVGGSVGTLSEIAFALSKHRPVATIGSWDLDPQRLPKGALLLNAADAAQAVDFVFCHMGETSNA